ncbi:hypothetical protein TEA_028015 [Camellia sinensis var. sinensis]|uniref:Uncharacterized protein n=1 Tax=Camellia sinensis var. sinensis TaxID=542762 RepID=A0A4S4E2K0_CAMSN|nr:hypothetical protein TEA_028015 [Camellia sinensis var. sinensis]
MERKVIVVCLVVGFLGLLCAVTGFAAEATRIKGSQVQSDSSSTCNYPSSPAFGLGLTAALALMVAQIIINVTTGCICCRRGPHQSNSNWTVALICFVVSWWVQALSLRFPVLTASTMDVLNCALASDHSAIILDSTSDISILCKLMKTSSHRFTFVIAFLLLLTGAALNDQHGEETMYFGNYYCYVVKPGVFAGAAVLSLASVILGIAYYLALNSVKDSNDSSWGGPPPNQSGIAMGQPHPPPNAQAFPPPTAQAYPPPTAQAYPPPNTQTPVFVHEDTYMRRQFA